MSRFMLHKNTFAFISMPQAWFCAVRIMLGEYRALGPKELLITLSLNSAFALCMSYKYKLSYSATTKQNTAGKKSIDITRFSFLFSKIQGFGQTTLNHITRHVIDIFLFCLKIVLLSLGSGK